MTLTAQQPTDHQQLVPQLLSSQTWLKSWAQKQLPARSLLRHGTSLEDLLQTTLLLAWEQLRCHCDSTGQAPEWWTPISRRCGYLKGVLRHVIQRTYRDPWHSTCQTPTFNFEATQSEFTDPSPGPFERSNRNETLRWLNRQLKQLTHQDRRIVLLYAQGRTYGEIALRVGSTESAVAKRRRRALAKMTREFLPLSHEEEVLRG